MEQLQRVMTKGEREDLIRLIKQREKVAKTAAEQRSASMLAEFESSVSKLHVFANNEVWRAAQEAATQAAHEAAEKIMAKAKELGIPEEFHPRISFTWAQRSEDAYRSRRDELRRVAKAEIDAMEKITRVQIEAESVRAQTQVIAHGLHSEAALAFLESLPAIENMMPTLDIDTIQKKLAERARRSGGGFHLIGND
jgi:replicative superfamily II helicase